MLRTLVRVSRKVLSIPYVRVGVVVGLVAVVGLGYWYRLEIVNAYIATRDAIRNTVGFGFFPLSVWVVVLLVVVAVKPTLVRKARWWIGSAVFAVFLIGALSLFKPSGGVLLQAFTTDDSDTLGGIAGEAIAGSGMVSQGVRLGTVFIVAFTIISPSLVWKAVNWLVVALVQTYVLAVVVGQASWGAASRATMGLKRVYDVKGPPTQPAVDFQDRLLDMSLGVEVQAVDTQNASEIPPETEMPPSASPAQSTKVIVSAGTFPRVSRDSLALDTPQLGFIAPMESGDIPDGTNNPQGPPVPGREAQLLPGTGAMHVLPGGRTTFDDSVEPVRESQPRINRYNRFWQEHHLSNGHVGTDDELAGIKEGSVDDSNQAGEGARVFATWDLPKMDLLVDGQEGGISDQVMADTADTITNTLADYGIEVEIGEIKPGPTVTMYGLVPGWVRKYKQVKVTDESGNLKLDASGKPVVSKIETRTRVKVDSIISREKDLSLALKTPSLRIETPVMGKSLVGIEVPNPMASMVTLRNLMKTSEFEGLREKAKLPIAFGKGSSGETMVVDLAKMPHLLVAGATGSGKSVFLNTLLSCLLMEKTPEELRLFLVDPKRVELTPYNGVPHLLTPVVTETDQVVSLLKGLIREMLDRYRRMEESGVRNIDSFNAKTSDRMPYIVVAVDELADLMMSASFDVEHSLCRLAQLGRATGIHLIVATQRPSVDVVTGLIKANFPSRVSFGVTSQIDSRTILDATGAERLLGRGDMLYLAVDASRPERVQGVYISDHEVDNVVNFWRSTRMGPISPVRLHAVGDSDSEHQDSENREDRDGHDEFLDKAIELAYRQKKLSTSLMQRRLRIGYPRAARLMDQLEEQGIVGPSDGSKSRDVIIGNA